MAAAAAWGQRQPPGAGVQRRFWRLGSGWAVSISDHQALGSRQVHREPTPEEVGACELTSLCFGAAPLLYCGSHTGRLCVWDMRADRCFLAWEADDGQIGGCRAEPPWPLGAWGAAFPGSPSAGAVGPRLESQASGDVAPTVCCPQECCCRGVSGWSAAATPGGCAYGPWGPCQS